jgi:nitroreductase
VKKYIVPAGFLFILFFICGHALAKGDIALPKPPSKAGMDIAEALQKRMSVREFSVKKVSVEDLSFILWAAMGQNRPDGKQTIPYAMGYQYLKLYVASADRVFRYIPEKHILKPVSDKNEMKNLGKQAYIAAGTYILIITADKEKIPNGVNEYAYTTAGCLAQNVYLMCAAKGLGTTLAAYMNTPGVVKALSLTDKEFPLYIMPIGAIK